MAQYTYTDYLMIYCGMKHDDLDIVDGHINGWSSLFDSAITKEPFIPNELSFDTYSRQAEALISKYTFDRAFEGNITNLDYCIFELAELLYVDAQQSQRNYGVASESVGNWKVNYENSGEKTTAFNKAVKAIIRKWAPPEAFYRGV